MRIELLTLVVVLMGCVGQSKDLDGNIVTVDGPIEPSQLGKSLSHEHALVDFIGAAETGYHRWDRDEVVSVVLPRLQAIKKLGYEALFECTPAYIGRDPILLQMLSKASGLKLITNTGYYGARENKFIPEWAMTATADELAEKWVEEFENGIEDTGVKPGFIKIGVDRGDRLSDFHETLVRAACRTHLKTGLTIACHTGPSKSIFQIAEILEEEGVSGEAFIWVHATRDDPQNLIKAAELGLWVSLDNLRDNANLLRGNVERLVALKTAGLLDRVLVSQDAGWYRPGEEGGGAFAPYTFVELNLVPALKKSGFTDEDIEALLVGNPARAYVVRVRSSK